MSDDYISNTTQSKYQIVISATITQSKYQRKILATPTTSKYQMVISATITQSKYQTIILAPPTLSQNQMMKMAINDDHPCVHHAKHWNRMGSIYMLWISKCSASLISLRGFVLKVITSERGQTEGQYSDTSPSDNAKE